MPSRSIEPLPPQDVDALGAAHATLQQVRQTQACGAGLKPKPRAVESLSHEAPTSIGTCSKIYTDIAVIEHEVPMVMVIFNESTAHG
jgi:hypothetical protein